MILIFDATPIITNTNFLDVTGIQLPVTSTMEFNNQTRQSHSVCSRRVDLRRHKESPASDGSDLTSRVHDLHRQRGLKFYARAGTRNQILTLHGLIANCTPHPFSFQLSMIKYIKHGCQISRVDCIIKMLNLAVEPLFCFVIHIAFHR